MMYQLLALPAAADRAANYVEGAGDNATPPDYSEWFEARSHQNSLLGLQAHDLTVTLRKTYGIPEIDDRLWDPVSHLKDTLNEIKDRQKKRSVEWDAVIPALPTPPATAINTGNL
jgi:hypothetical protein